ncbi:serine hydrolase domain-containing protein [Flavitalea sp. BT771]|uniref:serine hydrolase domain-containing protein n=1 Tax=Flavitalea sp. BT771 TaxID=3063329 RepID=UPI0026E29A04|nr:serine hydrolase domain-containing protein [Flavitalea sp. BT771]MDO6435147.1 serine hydrolase domain-containing protein [Flavitalea sp. BT771]MDV6224148.1 serine hydrolase domain-containing protein [Flavitalea sp. BT771]
MKNFRKILLFVFAFCLSTAYAQHSPTDGSFGEGIVTINLYAFAPNVPVPEDPAAILHTNPFNYFTYYIKGKKIYRNDGCDSSLINASSVSNLADENGAPVQMTMKVQMLHPSYLIDWTNRKVYFQGTKGSVSGKDLAKETSELFYRAMDSNRTIITSLGKGRPLYIAGRKCLKGNATTKTGEAFTFYYSADPLKVRSPLNGFMPANFPYSVMRLESATDWTNNDGTPSKGTAVLQIKEIKECQLADSLFNVPGVTFSQGGRLAARLDSLFGAYPSKGPGFVVSIEKKGTVMYHNAVGWADEGTRLDTSSNFRMASVTKQFTAMGIFLLEKEGRLGFDDPVGRWLPELPARVGRSVLIRHLLTHSSGLPDYEWLIPDTTTRQVLDADVLRMLSLHDSTYFPPGTKFRYSNSGFCLLALIIERVSHQSFGAFLRDRIFQPLGMDHSTVYEDGQPISFRAMGYARDSTGKIIPSDQSITSATKGDGGVYTSLADYSRWMRALQQGRLVQLPAVLKRLRMPIAGMADSYYAGGWFMTGRSPLILFHSGSTCGFANFVIQVPGDEWSIVYFSNLAGNSGPFRDMVRILREEGGVDLTDAFRLRELTN